MNRMHLIIALAFSTFALTAQNSDSISRFDLLLGDWKYEKGQNTYEEHWKKTGGSSLECNAISTSNADTTSTEFFRIGMIEGDWVLTAEVGNSQPTQFYLKVAESDRLSFERKDDSFPKRFNYTKKEDGVLVVWLDGKLNGRETKLEYLMKKTD